MAHAAFKAVGAEQPSAWKVRFLRRSVERNPALERDRDEIGSVSGSVSRRHSTPTNPLLRAHAVPTARAHSRAARLPKKPFEPSRNRWPAAERDLTVERDVPERHRGLTLLESGPDLGLRRLRRQAPSREARSLGSERGSTTPVAVHGWEFASAFMKKPRSHQHRPSRPLHVGRSLRLRASRAPAPGWLSDGSTNGLPPPKSGDGMS